MSEWKELPAEEYCIKVADGTHDTPKPLEVGEYLITSKHITSGKVDLSSAYRISNEDFAKINIRSKVDRWDVLLTMIGTVGDVILVDHEPNYAIKNIGLFKCGNETKAKWLKYYLQSPDGKAEIQARLGGTTQEYIALGELRKLPILFPPPAEQHAIVQVLSSLDDKIDLLHRQNKTLEGMAEALWRKMFVEGTEAGWEVLKLGDIAIVQNGFAFKSSQYVAFADGYLEVLKMGHIQPGGGLRTDPKTDYVPREDRLTKYVLSKGDIVMAMTDMKDNVVILGNPAMIDIDDKYVLNQRVARIYLKANDKLINSHLLYVQLKDPEFISILQSKANSGVQVNLSTESIKDCDILIPLIDVQREKGGTIIKVYLKKEHNDYQIRTLSRLRDTLLPKLMSGEVRVKG